MVTTSRVNSQIGSALPSSPHLKLFWYWYKLLLSLNSSQTLLLITSSLKTVLQWMSYGFNDSTSRLQNKSCGYTNQGKNNPNHCEAGDNCDRLQRCQLCNTCFFYTERTFKLIMHTETTNQFCYGIQAHRCYGR